MSFRSYIEGIRDRRILHKWSHGIPILGMCRPATASANVTGEGRFPSLTPGGHLRVTRAAEHLTFPMGASGNFTTARVSATGATLTAQRFLIGLLQVALGEVTGAAGSIEFYLEHSDDGSSWYRLEHASVSGTFSAASIGTGLARCWNFRCAGEYARIKVSTTSIAPGTAYKVLQNRLTLKA